MKLMYSELVRKVGYCQRNRYIIEDYTIIGTKCVGPTKMKKKYPVEFDQISSFLSLTQEFKLLKLFLYFSFITG